MTKLQLKNFNEQCIEIVIPTDKDNLYYEPTDKLNRFDLLQVFYSEVGKEIFIAEEIINEIVPNFLDTIKVVINNEVDVTGKIEPGRFGYFYNQSFFDLFMKDSGEDDVFKYILCSGIGIQIAIYAYGELVYVEVFPSFRYREGYSDEQIVENFKKFMENYAPIGVMKLDKNILLQWRQQVRDFFELKDDTIPY